MIRFLINGQIYIINFNISIYELLSFVVPKGYEVIIEYNHKIIFYENYKKIKLKDYDKIEFITVVGGG
jgi:thiamine biosynthesis protein ThiS